MQKIRIAGVQMDVSIGEIDENTDRVIDRARTAAGPGARLVVIPECVLSGDCFESLDEARTFGLTQNSSPFERLRLAAEGLNIHIVVGFLELDEDRLFNSAVCVGSGGWVGHYRKVHLPHLGVDQFTTSGSGSEIVMLAEHDLRIGMNICYDCSFPEAARVLMLSGADIIVLPTNWPPTSGLTADIIPNARALENNVYVMTVNRIGVERGFEFIGKSKICDPRGANIAFADHRNEEIIIADIDPAWSRRKHLVNIPGQHEVHRVKDRHPETYQSIADPK